MSQSSESTATEKFTYYRNIPPPREPLVKGPPFPKVLSRTTLPPVWRRIVENRTTPMYCLGWVMSYFDIHRKFDPDHKWNCLSDAFTKSRQYQNWAKSCADKWTVVRPAIIAPDDGTPNCIICLTDNVWEESIEMTRDEELMALAKEAFELEDDPQWHRCKPIM